jgi:hypothetical protein
MVKGAQETSSMKEILGIQPCDKATRERLHGFAQEAEQIGREFWRDPRTLTHNIIRALETAFQDGRVHEAFRRSDVA